MKKKDEKAFFDLVAQEANYISADSVRPIYYALLRLILKELKRTGKIRLPDWGVYRVLRHKRRRIVDPNDKRSLITIPSTNTVKFTACERLRTFVKNLPPGPENDRLKE